MRCSLGSWSVALHFGLKPSQLKVSSSHDFARFESSSYVLCQLWDFSFLLWSCFHNYYSHSNRSTANCLYDAQSLEFDSCLSSNSRLWRLTFCASGRNHVIPSVGQLRGRLDHPLPSIGFAQWSWDRSACWLSATCDRRIARSITSTGVSLDYVASLAILLALEVG